MVAAAAVAAAAAAGNTIQGVMFSTGCGNARPLKKRCMATGTGRTHSHHTCNKTDILNPYQRAQAACHLGHGCHILAKLAARGWTASHMHAPFTRTAPRPISRGFRSL
jgi:hypothetical protein